MRRAATEHETFEVGGQSSRRTRSRLVRKERLRRLALDTLEPRTLLAVLPPVTYASGNAQKTPLPPITLVSAGPNDNNSAPQVAIDRYDPRKLVAVWVNNNPVDRQLTPIIVQAAYSTDGGRNWSFGGNLVPQTLTDPTSSPQNPVPYSQTTDPTVAFDTQHNVYITVNEHNSSFGSGAIVIAKSNFSGGAPFSVDISQNLPGSGFTGNSNVIYQWTTAASAAYTPDMAVDDNLASFTDPATNVTQTDPGSNHVYVTWTNNDPAPPAPLTPANYNPFSIRLVTSADGGRRWTNNKILNEVGQTYQHIGDDRNASPKLAISQGSPSVPGGQVTVVWDDWGTFTRTSPNRDTIRSQRVNVGTNQTFSGIYAFPGASIGIALSTNPVTPVVTSFPINVNITDPNFATLSDLTVTLNIQSGSLNELSGELVGPNGQRVTLFRRRNGATIPFFGIQGANMGLSPLGTWIGATFDDTASQNINQGAAPYIGHYLPEQGSMNGPFVGSTPTSLNGTWTLVLTNWSTATSPTPAVVNWSLSLSSGGTAKGGNVTVGLTPVHGTTLGNFALTTPSTPLGIGPAPVIVSNNTLGSFSPYEGELYVAYTTRDLSVDSNPVLNTDIALAVSRNGGASWTTLTTKLNDDDGGTDGYTGSVHLPGLIVNGRSQFMPKLAIDSVTGTLVATWRDARNDVSNSRVATYMTTSIDGGRSFSKNVYANTSLIATDRITGNQVNYGPQPDNEAVSSDTLSFGPQMGLVAYNGSIIPVWSGNLNANAGDYNVPANLSIYARRMETASGPRVISGTMGPVGIPGDFVNTGTGPDGTPKPNHIRIVFDREVDPNTFKPDDVEVFYKGTTANAQMEALFVAAVTPITGTQFGTTQFQITFDPTKKADGSARTGPIKFTGTYSYLIKPGISDRIRSLVTPPAPQGPISRDSGPIDLAVPSGITPTTSTLSVTGLPSNQIITGLTVNLSISEVRDGNLQITLISPNGTSSTLYQNSSDNGQNFVNTTFSDNAGQSIFGGTAPYTGTFTPVSSLNPHTGQPVNGNYRLVILNNGTNDTAILHNWSITINSTAPSPSSLSLGNLMDQNADTITNQDVTAAPFFGLTPGDVFMVPTPAPTVPVNFDLTGNNLFPTPPYNQQTLPLIVSGPRLVNTTTPAPGYQPGSPDTLVLNGTVSSLDLHFDRDMNPSTVTPASVLRIMGPAGQITGPQTFTLPPASQNQTIPSGAGTSLSSTITVPTDNGTFPISRLAVAINAEVVQNSAITAFLIAPNGNRIQLFSGLGGSNFTNTVLDDSATRLITAGTAPYSGTFQPVNSLQAFVKPNGVPMDLAPSKTQNKWTLQLVNSKQGNVGKLISWSLIATPEISITPNPTNSDPTPASPRTYRINFPQQTLSGTYTAQLAASITSAAGDALDSNLNAGVEVLNGGGANVGTTPVTYNGTGLPLIVPNAGIAGPGELQSTINVPDNFLVQGITAAGLAGLSVKLNISGSRVPNFEATLVYHPGQSDQVIVPLFNFDNLNPVGNVGTNQGAGFRDTVFTDLSPTPIEAGGAPFFATSGFRSQNPLLSSSSYTDAQGVNHTTPGFRGLNVGGAWSLIIKHTGTSGPTARLNSWSLSFQKPLPSSGLGEPVADQASANFRIFTMSPTNALSSSVWTAVGPAAVFGGVGNGSISGSQSGRIGGLAVDPSDPSGNTVYMGGASGGVWKTIDFYNRLGPTWIPLTDFGPTFSLNIGSIAVFGRNNDPRQSIVFAATGEGDTASPGVGFLISKDGGSTWNLYDSTNNVSSIVTTDVNTSANLLPISSPARDHIFVGTSAFKAVVDPRLTPNGQVIIYAALSGPNGGIYRSQDTGQTWQLMRAGQATDVVLNMSSGTGAPGGNLQIVYGAFRGEGVFISPNQGQVWNLMAGTGGNPLLVNPLTQQNVNPITQPNPNGGLGRIQLATPVPTGNAVQDLIYQEWLYAVVIRPDSHLSGVYVTKDFGANWTRVRIPTIPPLAADGGFVVQAVPTNDINQTDYDIGGGPPGTGFPAQGNYDVSLAVDPVHPWIFYLGGTADAQSTGFLRVDTSTIWDAHNTTPYDNNGILGGSPITPVSVGPLTLGDPTRNMVQNNSSGDVTGGTTNLIGFSNGYIGNQRVFNGGGLTNNGAGVKWIPFDILGTDQHRIVTMVDPVTHLPRIIIGDDQGIFTAVDQDGTFFPGIGTAASATGSRNGNLQITQFYYGTAQPSNAAAQVAQALLFSSAQDMGAPYSRADVLQTGNIVWNQSIVRDSATGLRFFLGDATGVGSDTTGSGANYVFAWPCCGGLRTAFFQVTNSLGGSSLIGQTDGLLQASGGLPTPDPQWPSTFGANFAVNPINGNQVAVSSSVGRIFRTETALQSTVHWFEIASPAVLDNSYAPAIAFGAPDPNSPAGIGNLDNFMYIGTSAGRIFMSQVGGGGNGNSWANISNGLDGSTVQQIITNPIRGSHDAYAVTSAGVYYVPDSVALAAAVAAAAAGGPAVPANLMWQNISGNLFSLMHDSFGNTNFGQTLAKSLTSIQADWRYAIPNNPSQPAGPNTPSHPILYVSGRAGVYRSLDFGQTWSRFPNESDGAPVDGGYLPNNAVSSIAMSIGNIDVNTGRAVQQPGDPNVLVAATFGRGDFVIRLAPVVFKNSIQLSKTLPSPAGSDGGLGSNGLPIVNIPRPVFTGVSAQTAFGNSVRISLFDLTNPDNPVLVGGYDGTAATDITANQTDAYGNFSIQVNPNAFTTKGVKVLGIQATDASGTKGGMSQFSFNYEATGSGDVQPPAPPTLALAATSDSSGGLGITNDNTPQFIGVTDPGVAVTLVDAAGNPIAGVAPVMSDPVTGAFVLEYPEAAKLADGVYTVKAKATNSVGSTFSPTVTFTIKTTGPATNVFQGLSAATDTGIKGDNITVNRLPTFIGTTVANTTGNPNNNTKVDLLQVTSTGTVVLATVTAQANGAYSVQLPAALNDGKITLRTRVRDVANNLGPISSQITVTITSAIGDYNLDGKSDTALFRRTSGTTGTWIVPGITPSGGLTFGDGGVVPFSGDFNYDGVSDLAYYNLATSTWFIQNSQGTNLQPGNPPNPPTQIPLGSKGAIPVAGDFSGSGGSEVGVFIPGKNGAASTWLIQDNAQGLKTFTFGQANDIPVPGDYEALGKDQLAVYRPSTGQILVLNLTNPANPVTKTFNIGAPNQIPVPGDYDNISYFNGGKAQPKTEPAVFNPATGLMTITGPTGNYTVQFQKGDVPAPGDYDGIGQTEPAVFRPSAKVFVIYNPITKTFRTVAAGNSTDVAVLAPYSFRLPLLKATINPTIGLATADDSSKGLKITNVTRPHIIGKTDPKALIDLINAATGAVIGTASADGNGNYSVAPTVDLTDGSYSFQTRAYGYSGDTGLKSGKVSLKIQTSVQVVSVSPVGGTPYRSLPGGKIVVTFSHPLAGLDKGFANRPFAVYLVPRGPDGAFAAPTGLDAGSTPINATLEYKVNANGTSSITLTPKAPLGTDVYLIAVSGVLRDLAGNPMLSASGQPGTYYSTFSIKATTPNGTAFRITSVTTKNGSVNISNNATIAQPDTIAIAFNKSLNFLMANRNTVQLLAGPSNTVVKAAVTYSPSTKTIYLTPEERLIPGTTYRVRVSATLTDDQGFPNPDLPYSLGATFTRAFKVSNAGVGAGTSPLQVVKNNGKLAISPGPGPRTSPVGYISVTFSEALDMTSLKRFAAMLTLQAGGLDDNAFDKGDAALNAKLAFNPNTNQLIIVPTVPLGSGKYLLRLGQMKAKNGDTLINTPIYSRFTLDLEASSSISISQASHVAASHVLASISTTSSSGVAITPSISTSQVASDATASPKHRNRPGQGDALDQLLGGFRFRKFFATRRGQRLAAILERLADERANGD